MKGVLIALALLAGWPFGVFGQEEEKTIEFKSAGAIAAKTRYDKALAAAAQRYNLELDAVLKRVLLSSNLDEANLIEAVRKEIPTGEIKEAEFQTSDAKSAQARHGQNVAIAKRQYLRDLEAPLKAAMTPATIQEANAIASVRKKLEEDLGDAGPLRLDAERGLTFKMSGNREVWKNIELSLPAAQTPVSLSGKVVLPGKIKTLGLRGAQAYGSDRMVYTIEGKQIELKLEGNHRYVVIEVPVSRSELRLRIENSLAANPWLWGPLQWSLDGGAWRDIPLKNLSPE